jgi:hypothetical protein
VTQSNTRSVFFVVDCSNLLKCFGFQCCILWLSIQYVLLGQWYYSNWNFRRYTVVRICDCLLYWSAHIPNVVVEWFTLLLRVQEVPGSNLDPETGYPDWGFSWFSSVHAGECRGSTLKLGHDRFLPNSIKFIIYFSLFHSTLYSPIYWKSLLNKIQSTTVHSSSHNPCSWYDDKQLTLGLGPLQAICTTLWKKNIRSLNVIYNAKIFLQFLI